MLNDTDLYTILNVSAITSLLDSYASGKALFNARIVPEDFTDDNSINFYRVGPSSGALEYGSHLYVVSCRSDKEVDADEIASTVYTTVNRESSGDAFFICTVLPTLPPQDETDNFNVPVEVQIKSR